MFHTLHHNQALAQNTNKRQTNSIQPQFGDNKLSDDFARQVSVDHIEKVIANQHVLRTYDRIRIVQIGTIATTTATEATASATASKTSTSSAVITGASSTSVTHF